jgi:hypothetical protein
VTLGDRLVGLLEIHQGGRVTGLGDRLQQALRVESRRDL